jgi:ABC-type transport system substrate-binding protein
MIGEKGLEPDPVTNAIRPHVLTSWEVADPSGMTLVFKVHPKLFIHDMAPWNGRQFNAEDVAFNLMRIGGMMAKGGPREEKNAVPLSQFQRATMVANIVKAEAVDNLTVKVTLSRPNNAFFNGLTENRVPFMPKEMPDIGFDDPTKAAGIGAFQITSRDAAGNLYFKKNPRYGEFRPSEPYFDTWDYITIPDTGALIAAFVSGQTQVLDTPSPEIIQTVRSGRPDANLYTTVDQNWQHIRMSVEYPRRSTWLATTRRWRMATTATAGRTRRR